VIDTKERVEILVRVLGPCQVDRRGINAAFRCPGCANSKKQKFVVKLDTGQYHCWVCEIKGDQLQRFSEKHHLILQQNGKASPEYISVILSMKL